MPRCNDINADSDDRKSLMHLLKIATLSVNVKKKKSLKALTLSFYCNYTDESENKSKRRPSAIVPVYVNIILHYKKNMI